MEFQFPLRLWDRTHYALTFVDAGRVWTPDARFVDPEEGFPLLDSFDGTFVGLGGGVSWSTAVGPIRLMVGYKLNPSPVDLRDPLALGELVVAGGGALEDIPERRWARWHVHLGFGPIF